MMCKINVRYKYAKLKIKCPALKLDEFFLSLLFYGDFPDQNISETALKMKKLPFDSCGESVNSAFETKIFDGSPADLGE